jgi:dihydropteroate synthase
LSAYFRPLIGQDACPPPGARPVAGSSLWYDAAECLTRSGPGRRVDLDAVPPDIAARIEAPRPDIAGLRLDRPRIMGILNVTPDSFSDGGRHFDPDIAIASGLAMHAAGADILDVGGESTRPGAETIAVADEIARVVPVIAGLRAACDVAISIDTRKAAVAGAALDAGATLVNDVSGFTFDPDLAPLCAARGVPVCAMHARGDPATMQADPRYDNVLLDVCDALAGRVAALGALGIPPGRILLDPGIGFGKTIEHNLALLRGIALFHTLGCALLLGVSRKGFIGTLGRAPQADRRAPGSIALGLAALAQGVHILRVHDVDETAQALRLWQAVR